MAGQNKFKVSSKINGTLTESYVSGASSDAPDNGSSPKFDTIADRITLSDHVYALIQHAKNEGLEPVEMLNQILKSGSIPASEKQVSATPFTPIANRRIDPTELNCIDDELRDLVY